MFFSVTLAYLLALQVISDLLRLALLGYHLDEICLVNLRENLFDVGDWRSDHT